MSWTISLITFLSTEYKGILAERYGIEEEGTPLSMLEAIAEKRGCLLKGKGLDYSKAAGILIEDFRSGRLGRLTLELP